jgi:hypothetical protein
MVLLRKRKAHAAAEPYCARVICRSESQEKE